MDPLSCDIFFQYIFYLPFLYNIYIAPWKGEGSEPFIRGSQQIFIHSMKHSKKTKMLQDRNIFYNSNHINSILHFPSSSISLLNLLYHNNLCTNSEKIFKYKFNFDSALFQMFMYLKLSFDSPHLTHPVKIE